MYDCIVIGAGPGGGATAYHLARRGRSVLVLEKETLPRYKPCGGGIPPVVQEWFDFDFSPVISARVHRIRYTWTLGDVVEAPLDLPEPMWMVRRDEFDQFLVTQAQRQGALLKSGTPVLGISPLPEGWRVQTTCGEFDGRYLVGADGAKGNTARWLGLDKRKITIGGAIEVEIPAPVPQPDTAHFEFGMVKAGYLWNFPKAGCHSIGIGTFGRQKVDLKTPLARYIEGFGLSLAGVTLHGHPLLLWQGNTPLHTRCALLVGESAGIVDPFTAEGIRPSLHTGVLAAQFLDQALGGDEQALAAYTAAVHEYWGEDLKWASRLASVFYRFPELGYRLGIKRPGTTRRMGQLLSGEVRYREVAQRALHRLSPVT
ncbi:geranylgeranyl reductase family protein [Anthocerotibacter panamensis]|uniref:geranylgeranyl reductase family protein n=1 Tax=Anthocerotibacter panamensis TaxID=2857077 RepID=UPI001C4027C0|nr:geranylgeranyl reductase family protein [Anthocerotibacter panamensis]